MKSISASSESPFPPTLLELLSENRGLLQGRGNPSNLNQLQRDSAVRTRRHCERRHGVQVLSRGGLRASAVRDQQQRAGCAHRKGLGWWHESPVRLTTTHSTRPISSTETPQTTNAYPLKGAKSGDNLLLSLIRRGKKSFRRLSPALEDSVAAKWTTFNHTPGPTGTQKQQPQDRHRALFWVTARTRTAHSIPGLSWPRPPWQNCSGCGATKGQLPRPEVFEIQDSRKPLVRAIHRSN